MRQLWRMQRPWVRRGQHAETQSSHDECEEEGVREFGVPCLLLRFSLCWSSIEMALMLGGIRSSRLRTVARSSTEYRERSFTAPAVTGRRL